MARRKVKEGTIKKVNPPRKAKTKAKNSYNSKAIESIFGPIQKSFKKNSPPASLAAATTNNGNNNNSNRNRNNEYEISSRLDNGGRKGRRRRCKAY